MQLYLTFQEEEDSGLDEVSIGALPTPPFGHCLLLSIPVTEESALYKAGIISVLSTHNRMKDRYYAILIKNMSNGKWTNILHKRIIYPLCTMNQYSLK